MSRLYRAVNDICCLLCRTKVISASNDSLVREICLGESCSFSKCYKSCKSKSTSNIFVKGVAHCAHLTNTLRLRHFCRARQIENQTSKFSLMPGWAGQRRGLCGGVGNAPLFSPRPPLPIQGLMPRPSV